MKTLMIATSAALVLATGFWATSAEAGLVVTVRSCVIANDRCVKLGPPAAPDSSISGNPAPIIELPSPIQGPD